MSNPVVIQYGLDGQPLATDPGTPASKALTVQTDPTAPLDVNLDTSTLATKAKQDSQQATLDAISSELAGTLDVHITDASVAVTAASLPLPSGASTAAKQDTGNASLASIDAKLTNPLPVSGSVTATVSGVATAANQATEISSLASIDGKLTTPNIRALASGTDSVTTVPSGTQTVSISGTPNVAVTSSALPTGAATEATLSAASAKLPATLGAKTTANSLAVNIASDQTVPVSGTVTANLGTLNGAATAAKQPALGTAGTPSTDVLTVQGATSMTALKVDGSAVVQPVSGTVAVSNSFALDATLTGGTQRNKITDGTNNAAVKAASTAAAATDPALVVANSPNFTGPTTSTLTNTAASASSVTVLSANTARQSAVLVNDSTAVCYVKFGSTASSTSFTYYMAGSSSGVPSTLEVPQGPNGPYNGIITAIWASATGSMRATEVTA